MSNDRVEREVTTHDDGSRSITDVSIDRNSGNLTSHTYNVSPDSKTHDHVVQEYDGDDLKYKGGHSEEERPWHDKKDYILSELSNLSFFELQLVESRAQNKYVQASARLLMQQAKSSFVELSLEHPRILIRNG